MTVDPSEQLRRFERWTAYPQPIWNIHTSDDLVFQQLRLCGLILREDVTSTPRNREAVVSHHAASWIICIVPLVMLQMHIRHLKYSYRILTLIVLVYIYPTHPFHETSPLSPPTTDIHETVSDSPPGLLIHQQDSFHL
jgi:hypothetical protein